MGHRAMFGIDHFRLRFSESVRPWLLSLCLVFSLSAFAAFAQDATPPPPPPDAQPSASSGQGPAQAATQSNVRAVRLSDVEGQVQIFQGDRLAFDQAQPNMPAVEGMRFVTGDNGRLEIEFEDGSVARVTPNSSIRLTQLKRNADGSTVTQIDALTGLSYYELNGRGGQYSVHFASDTAVPIDSAVFRVALDSAPNELAVMHGAAHVTDSDGMITVDVHPSQTFQVDPQQPGQYTVAQNIAADSWDQWNSDRDSALAQLESSETTARSSSGNPDDAAWNDLDYYGNWYNLPGYGQVWSPSGVGAGWDPFGVGSWGYYPSFGYTWISGYPWGWWPYHCGAWDFVDAWGWIWVPGNCGWGLWGAGWYPFATVWSVPHGYHPPPRPRPGPGPNPVRPQPLIAVDRGPQFAAPFHFDNGQRPAPRPLNFDGKTIEPLEASIHPIEKGPVGETFTNALVRTHPEMAPAIHPVPAAPGYRTSYPPGLPARPYVAQPSAPRYGSPSAAHSYTSGGGAARPAYTGGAAHPSSGGGGGSTHH